MPLVLDDTIVAIASPSGGGARGIVRLSGPQVRECLESCFRTRDAVPLAQVTRPSVFPGWLALNRIQAPLPGDLYYWPTARSYTRQPLAELHTFGSPPLLEAALRTVCQAGARLAGPGEFTLRAFLAGRLDLTQAEAVLGVIDACDRRQLEVALEQLAGGLAGPLSQLRNDLLDLLAHLEAGLDFVEEDVEFISADELDRQLSRAASAVSEIAARLATRTEVQSAVRVVLIGPPNAGKSSLFNALTGRAAALVSESAGTTRDYLERKLEWEEGPCVLVDTAGVDALADNPVSNAAQESSALQRQRADVEIICLDASRPLQSEDDVTLKKAIVAGRLIVFTKVDLGCRAAPIAGCIETSCLTSQGLDQLRKAIGNAIRDVRNSDAPMVASTASRCRECLRLAAESLARALDVVRLGGGEELVAAEIRIALDELGQVVGAVYTDDVLDRVFSRFCIGK